MTIPPAESNSAAAEALPLTRIDLLTVAAMGILAYFAAALVHEGAHAATGLAFGVRSLKLTSFDVEFDSGLITPLQQRFVSAAGIVFNFLAASILHFTFRKASERADSNIRYFRWLLIHINLFVGGGYLMALSFVSFGDVNSLLAGLHNELLLRIATTILGAMIMIFTLMAGASSLNPFLGTNPTARKKRAVQLSITPYIAGCCVNTLAAVFANAGVFLTLCSAAAASFGGTSWMLMMIFPIDGGRRLATDPPLTPYRSLTWIVLGVVAAALNFGLLGRGVHIQF